MPASTSASRAQRIAELGYDYDSQPRTRRDSCDLCGARRFVRLSHVDRYGYPASADGCLRCGLVFLNPVMTAEAYGRFYTSHYRPLVSAYHGRRIDADSIQIEQKDYARTCGDFLEPWISSRGPQTLLDIGGSTGVVASALKDRFDLTATVLDPAPLELDVARQLGLEVIEGLVEDADLPEGAYGLVTLCQTVDHLLDVTRSLAKIRRVLRDDGLFFADIVDFRAAYRRTGSVEGAIKIDHPFYLTNETMQSYLAKTGFDVLGICYAEDHLHVGYLCSPGEPSTGFEPAASSVSEQWREIRSIQNPLPASESEP